MGTSIQHLVPDRVKPSLSLTSDWAECPDVKNYN